MPQLRYVGAGPPGAPVLGTGMSAMMDIVDPRQRLPLNLEAEQLAQNQGDRERVLRSIFESSPVSIV